MKVRTILVRDSRDLITLDEDSSLWLGAAGTIFCPGAIVRLRPPSDASDEKVEEVRRRLLGDARAASVKMLPRRRAKVVVEPARPAKAEGIRTIAEALVEEANTEDRQALRERVGEALTRAGL